MKLLYNISLNRSWQTLNFVIKFVLQPKFGKLGIFKSSQIMLRREEAQGSATEHTVHFKGDPIQLQFLSVTNTLSLP